VGRAALLLLLVLITQSALADAVRVLDAKVGKTPDGLYRFVVTLAHGDTGWAHYADRWEVVAPDGTVLATRILHHPHVDEQPFTRSLGQVTIPAGIRQVIIRAHDSVHGYGETTVTLDLP